MNNPFESAGLKTALARCSRLGGMILWAIVTLILFSALLLFLAALGPLRGTPSARPLSWTAAVQAVLGFVLVGARLSGAV